MDWYLAHFHKLARAVCISLGMLSLRGFTFLSFPYSLEKVFVFFKGIPFLPASQGRKIQIANMLWSTVFPRFVNRENTVVGVWRARVRRYF